jgi:RHS repeat-associated protein
MTNTANSGAARWWAAFLVVLAGLPLVATGQMFQSALPYNPDAPPVNQPPVLFSPAVAPLLPSGVAVGRTQGSMGVSPSGAANYSIPLWTPPGIAGLGPSLALTYSSDSDDGWYGVGWGVAGFSTISRCAKTYDQDGIFANVDLSSGDRFCLDGNKLRSFAGTYGADAAQYQTEIADFSLVISHGVAGTGPAWFEVRGKNGLIYQYGNTAHSALIATGTTTVLTWALNRISDRFGNHVDFDYTNDTANQVLRPLTIQYTTPPAASGAQTTPNYQVSFAYVARTGTVPNGFIAGAQFMEPYLAQTITVSSWNGTAYAAVRTYNLTYVLSPTTGRSELNQITECSPTQCFPATTVTYQAGTAGWNAGVSTPGTSTGLWTSLVVDFNGDGVDDIVYQNSANTWLYMLGQRSGTYVGPYTLTPAPTGAIAMDFNGDGKTDILTVNGANWRILYFQSAGAAFTKTDTAIAAPAGGTGNTIIGDVDGDGREDIIYAVSSGIGLWHAQDHIYYRLNSGSNFGAEQTLATIGTGAGCDPCEKLTLTPFGQYSPYNTHIHRPDVNGDGRADFFANITSCTLPDTGGCTAPTYKWRLYVSNATGVGYTGLGILAYGATGLASNLVPPLFGDFNGDGCTDVASVPGGLWTVNYGTCLRAGASTALSAGVATGVAGHVYPVVADWDGDGMDDIVEPDTATSGHFGYIRSTGTNFSPWVSTGLAYNNADVADNAILVADRDGDGLYELVYPVGAGYTITQLPHKGATVISDVAKTITDGFGVAFSPTYSQLTNSTVYTKGSGAIYPERDTQSAHNVVSSYTASDGVGGSYTVTQTYYTERQDASRQQSEGFAKVRARDSRNNFYHEQQFGQLFPFTGVLLKDSLYQSNGTTFISDVAHTPATKVAATLASTANQQRYFPYVTKTVNEQYELNGALNGTKITRATTNYYFQGTNNIKYGNPSKIVTTTDDLDPNTPWPGSTFTDTVIITPYEDGGTGATGWCIHLPSQVSETRSQPSGTPSSLTHTTTYSVDANQLCEVNNKTVEPNTIDQVLTALLYDGCGNVKSVAVTGKTVANTAMTARTTTADYGTHCLQPEIITDALTKQTTLGYRYDLGLLTSKKDPNLLTVSWTYNDIGQKTREDRPDGTRTAFTPNACTSPSYCGDSDQRYYIHRAEQDSTAGHATFWVTDTYFDQFDRLKYEKPQQSNGAQVSRFIDYDNRGRVVAQTNPSGNGFGSFTTSALYDDLNRPTDISRPTSATNSTLLYTRLTYQGRTKTIKDPKLYVTTQQSDVLGELRRVTDPDGLSTTDYAYNPFGTLVSTTDPAGNTTSTSYDTLGYLPTGSSDPDRGTWVTQFDSLGELVNLRDAKTTAPAWTQQWTYDALGRPKTRVESEGTSTWTWGTVAANHEIGQLKQLTGLSDTEDYTYDAYGRPATHKQTWNGTAYIVSYAYNTLGKLDTLTYPATPLSANAFAVKYGYSNGFLSSLQNYTGGTAGTTFWQLTPSTVNMDPWGHVVDETLGTTTPVTIHSAFDAVTGWLGTRQIGTSGNPTSKQSLAYGWDANGNLGQRQDLKQALTEVFTYDNLNRLQNSTLNGVANFGAVIDPSGNISSRTEAGTTYTYTYDTTRKHEVTTVNGVAYGYDANGNMSTRNGYMISWSSANLPLGVSGAGGVSAAFFYGPDRQRKQQTAVYSSQGTNGTETTIYVAGLMEIETTPAQTHYKHFLTVPGGTQIIYDLQSVSGAQTTYVTADHLGSGNLLLDSTGAILINESFSAYGYRRKGDWSAPLGAASPAYTTIASTTRRGYTDAWHEMIDNVGLIHMNGRMYDPVIGRFISPDPLGGRVGDSQSLNPYSYVDNQPLTATDPTGFTLAKVKRVMNDPWAFASFGQSSSGVDVGGDSTYDASEGTPDVPIQLVCFPGGYPPCPDSGTNNGWDFANPNYPLMVSGWQNKPGSSIAPETGGTGATSTGSTDQENTVQTALGKQTECLRSGVRVAQGIMGAVQFVAGGVQAIEGTVQTGAGILAAPETGGVSLLAVPSGAANAALGSAALLDGGMMFMSAVRGSGDPPTTFGLIGQQYGGESGRQTGDLANIAALTAALASGTSASRAGTLASAIAAQGLASYCSITIGN